MISEDEALTIARQQYPAGPEALIERLKIPVLYSPMGGCDGWCITDGTRAVIRLNSTRSPKRQRFTLAHELGHLVLGVPTMLGESLTEMLSSDNEDEKRVNAFAAELLIPTAMVKASIHEVPVIATALKRLAKESNVSEVSAALRVANLAQELGLENASVVHFDEAGVKWQWSRTLRMSKETANQLLAAASETAPDPFRIQHDGNVVVASLIENSFFGSATLFTQLLPPELGNTQTSDERRRKLEGLLFKNQPNLKNQINGMIGALKNRIKDKSIEEIEEDFWGRYTDPLGETVFNSNEGREYVRLRISQWLIK